MAMEIGNVLLQTVNTQSPKAKKRDKVGDASLGAVIGGTVGACAGRYIVSDKFLNIAKEQRCGKLLAKLGETPAKAGKAALGVTVGLAVLGGIIGLLCNNKKDVAEA